MSPLAAIVTPVPGGRGGGVEHHVGLLAGVLSELGWEVREVGAVVDVSPWTRRLGREPRTLSRAAVAPLADVDADLVITNGFLGGGLRRLPRIHVYHGTMVAHALRGERDLPARERYTRALSFGFAEWAAGGHRATTVAVSQQVAGEVRRYYKRDVDSVIELCADLDNFAPRSRAKARKRLGLDRDAKLALFVGRSEYRKGSDMLSAICARAGCGLMVAGDAAPAGAIHLGQLDHAQLPWAYAAADAVLFPSRYEGFGFVSLEAVASSRPLIATRTGWAPALAAAVPGYAPYIVEPELEPLAAALRSAIERPHDVPLDAALKLVRETASIELFRDRWRRLISSVSAAGV